MSKNSRKIIRIGFDLDGVIVGKPPIISQGLMDSLVRNKSKKELSYRYPKTKFERFIRWVSHNPILRPPIWKNVEIIKELSKSSKCKLYVVSSRYSFLKERTIQWFGYYRLDDHFDGIYINTRNRQPHIYKSDLIKKLKLDIFIDDDLPLIKYLRKNLPSKNIIYVEKQKNYLKKIYQ